MAEQACATDVGLAPVPTSAFRTVMTKRGAAESTVTLVLAAAAWVIAIRLMDGMGPMGGMAAGPETPLGTFGSFAAAWMSMMAAMMLPGAAPAVAARVRTGGRASVFIASYLGLWAVVGGVLYVVYRPHGSAVAGAVVIAAGAYELTPLKRRCREACRAGARSGLAFGVCCVGTTIGLMAVLAAVGLTSIFWMSAVAAVTLAQKLMPAKRAVDVPLAATIVALGIWILGAPSSVPGLMPAL
jgi:predicted metal-binding membrane protein